MQGGCAALLCLRGCRRAGSLPPLSGALRADSAWAALRDAGARGEKTPAAPALLFEEAVVGHVDLVDVFVYHEERDGDDGVPQSPWPDHLKD